MGNFLQRANASNDSVNYPTPQIVALTPTEVQIIKETWKIPSANVSRSLYGV